MLVFFSGRRLWEWILSTIAMQEHSPRGTREFSHSLAHRGNSVPSLCISVKNDANYEISSADPFYPFPRLLRDRTQFHFFQPLFFRGDRKLPVETL
jgi:hypothetical protein